MVGGTMGKKNRTNYSNRYNREPEIVENVIEETETIDEDIEVVTEEKEEQPKILKVSIPDNCKLAIREQPSTESVALGDLINDAQVMITEDLYSNWYGIITESGIEGYVLKDYVELV